MKIMAIDPHVTRDYHYIVMNGDEVEDSGMENLTRLYSKIITARPDLVAIEGQYVSPKNMKMGLELAASRGQVEALCKIRNIPCKIVNPKSWQAYHNMGDNEKKKLKRAIRARVAKNYGIHNPCTQNCFFIAKYTENKLLEENNAKIS